MEEMLEDTLDMEDDEELEEEADAEVDKVLFDLTDGKLGQVGTIKDELPVGFLLLEPLPMMLTVMADAGGADFEGGDGEEHGKVSGAAEWDFELNVARILSCILDARWRALPTTSYLILSLVDAAHPIK